MGEDNTRGDNAASNREDAAHAGWVTTQVAARSLAISPRTVRWHIEQGHIEAKPQGEGVKRSWLVSIDSLQAFRDARQRQGQSPGGFRETQKSADSVAAQSPGNTIRELADRLVEEASRAAEFRVRLEISEKAESTLREELAEERRRREETERERNDLRKNCTPSERPQKPPRLSRRNRIGQSPSQWHQAPTLQAFKEIICVGVWTGRNPYGYDRFSYAIGPRISDFSAIRTRFT